MIEALMNGKLTRISEIKKSPKGVEYAHFLLTVNIGEKEPVLVSGIAFEKNAHDICGMKNGDVISVTGNLKLTKWIDKAGSEKHGLSITVNKFLGLK